MCQECKMRLMRLSYVFTSYVCRKTKENLFQEKKRRRISCGFGYQISWRVRTNFEKLNSFCNNTDLCCYYWNTFPHDILKESPPTNKQTNKTKQNETKNKQTNKKQQQTNENMTHKHSVLFGFLEVRANISICISWIY